MWYHYLVLLIALYVIGSALYTQITGRLSWYDRLSGAVTILLGLIAASWSYNGIYTPPPMFGARRY